MEYIIGIAIIALIFYFMRGRSEPSQRQAPSRVTRKRDAEEELGWLRERWKLAEVHRQSGNESIFPKWYFDDATERQKKRLNDLGIETEKELTKGQVSDLIGIHEPAEERNLAILKFFKKPTKNMNQTRARHEATQILLDPENAEAWENRPPTQAQKEFFKFFDLKPEKNLTAPKAEKIISKYEGELAEDEDPRLDDWEAFSEILEELSDAEMRADYEIKKPSISLIKSALEELTKSGKSYQDVADDIDLLVDKLVEMKPNLQRD